MCVQSNTFCFSVHMCGPVTSYMRAVQKTRKYFWGVKKKKEYKERKIQARRVVKHVDLDMHEEDPPPQGVSGKKHPRQPRHPAGFYVLEKLFGSPPDVGSGPFLYTYLPPAADRSWKRTLKIPVRCVQRESTCRISVCLSIYTYTSTTRLSFPHTRVYDIYLTVSTYI